MRKVLRLLLIIAALAANVAIADAQQAIFLVRHAEQTGPGGPGSGDPPLTEAGQQRAKRLGSFSIST